jgi:hypothetical protein
MWRAVAAPLSSPGSVPRIRLICPDGAACIEVIRDDLPAERRVETFDLESPLPLEDGV